MYRAMAQRKYISNMFLKDKNDYIIINAGVALKIEASLQFKGRM